MKWIGNRFVRRKWGWYLTIIARKHFKVKLLCFRPWKACSNQFHSFRSELWLFLKGKGRLNRLPIEAGQWAIIHAQHMHQYRAKDKTYVLEIQYGEKCEEEDIVRV